MATPKQYVAASGHGANSGGLGRLAVARLNGSSGSPWAARSPTATQAWRRPPAATKSINLVSNSRAPISLSWIGRKTIVVGLLNSSIS